MFSALTQNSPLYIIKKGNKLEYKVGVVESITAPQFSPYGGLSVANIDIIANVDNSSQTFKNVPSNLSVANFPKDGLIISETKEGLISELENIIQTSRNIVDSFEYNKSIVNDGEEIMKKINPKFAKDAERDDTINFLKNDVANMKGDINKILSILTKNENSKTL